MFESPSLLTRNPDPPLAITLEDPYDLTCRRVLLSGPQAIVRLLLLQKAADEHAGLQTAGFISGYRGSPLAGLDRQFWRARKYLKKSNILFEPGLNEDLAATAVWGTQQAEMRREGRYDGVFSLWYSKGPGIDRSGDALRHANMAGSSKHGGVIALMGDDHTAESSTLPHHSEFVFVDSMIPILSPSTVGELIDYGLFGFALSRFSGTWVGLKAVKDTIESTGIVSRCVGDIRPCLPDDFIMPLDGVHIRPFDTPLAQEERLYGVKSEAIRAFIRVNPINQLIASGGKTPRLGIITTGKSYLDTWRALELLGFRRDQLDNHGIRLFKVGCPWPLLEDQVQSFAQGLSHILVVEEKRALVETQVYQALYGLPNRPLCAGKKDTNGRLILPAIGALTPHKIAQAIGEQLLQVSPSLEMEQILQGLRATQSAAEGLPSATARRPHYCSGCPHNTSTVVPKGMRASAGIGCHYMVQWMDRSTDGFTHMGAEGANWIGEAPFSKRTHLIQNLGDGTYNHSGVLPIRWAIITKTPITYKILFNNAVAMTGGQPLEGGLTVDKLAQQLHAEGVAAIAVVADNPQKYPDTHIWPANTSFHHRDDLEKVQQQLGLISGVTVLIYDQACAAELRRQRKRKQAPDPNQRVVINPYVCEGCGDCSKESNCVSIQPFVTEFGRKRVIEQSTCNKDFSCVKGFCPSFVTVHGGTLKGPNALSNTILPLDFPHPPFLSNLDRPWNIVVTGIGGTGIITIGAILAMAAHLEGKGCATLDMTGLAQKGGSVQSHVRLSSSQEHMSTIRIDCEEADVILGCDLLVTASKTVLSMVKPHTTQLIINTAEVAPGEFVRDASYQIPIQHLKETIIARAGGNQTHFFDARAVALNVFGESMMANMIMLGYSYQLGHIPLEAQSLEKALQLNGQDVEHNIHAFRLGRQLVESAVPSVEPLPKMDDLIHRRVQELTAYQNSAYGARYANFVEYVRVREMEIMGPQSGELTLGVVHNLFKLMAIKDEYEVARLYTNGRFRDYLSSTFEGEPKGLTFHLAPPLLNFIKDPRTGLPRKWRIPGRIALPLFHVLARMKFLRGTGFDPFGYLQERRSERAFLALYERTLTELLIQLSPGSYKDGIAYARLPEKVRGFGHVKEKNMAIVQKEMNEILQRFKQEYKQAA